MWQARFVPQCQLHQRSKPNCSSSMQKDAAGAGGVRPQQGEELWHLAPAAFSRWQQNMEGEKPPWEAPACPVSMALSEWCSEAFPSAWHKPAGSQGSGTPPLSFCAAEVTGTCCCDRAERRTRNQLCALMRLLCAQSRRQARKRRSSLPLVGVVGGQTLLLPPPQFQPLTDRPRSDPARAYELVCVASVGTCPGPTSCSPGGRSLTAL